MIPCYFCEKAILEDLVVHSLDDNHDNWDAANKVNAHRACHSGYHASRRARTPWSKTSSRIRIEEPLLLKIEAAIEDGIHSSFHEFVFVSIEQLLEVVKHG